MRTARTPFKFAFDRLTVKGREHLNSRADGIQISLPCLSFIVRPDEIEQ